MCTHQRMRAAGPESGDKKRGQIGGHQQEDQQGDEAGLPGELLAQPLGPDEKTADEKPENPRGAGQGEDGGKIRVKAAKPAGGIQKTNSKPHGEVVQRDQRKGAEAPEDEGVGQAGKRALANDFGLAEHLPDKFPHAAGRGERG